MRPVGWPGSTYAVALCRRNASIPGTVGAEGDVPAGNDCSALARFVAAVLHGMSLQARDGAGRAALERAVDWVMAAWDRLAS